MRDADRRTHARRAGDLTAIESALVADVTRLTAVNAEHIVILMRARTWLGKFIADGAHLNAIRPSDCVRTLERIETAIAVAGVPPC
jgi:hypothetical protein